MLGALIGDTVGSVYEFHNIKTKDFDFLTPRCHFTDDTVMTMAVAQWLMVGSDRTQKDLERCMVDLAKQYPMAGYGGGFRRWLFFPGELRSYDGTDNCGLRRPYNSFGNGSAMRVSGCGWYFDTLEETEHWAGQSAAITHNHPEGIKGAQSVAAAIFMARTGHGKQAIKDYVVRQYGYDLSKTCDEIRPDYQFNETCQDTVPQAFAAFFESADFEDCIRLGVSLGGDTDTLCAIAGSMAEAFYGGIPGPIARQILPNIPNTFRTILIRFADKCSYRLPDALQ